VKLKLRVGDTSEAINGELGDSETVAIVAIKLRGSYSILRVFVLSSFSSISQESKDSEGQSACCPSLSFSFSLLWKNLLDLTLSGLLAVNVSVELPNGSRRTEEVASDVVLLKKCAACGAAYGDVPGVGCAESARISRA
jgi:hypothetical protein